MMLIMLMLMMMKNNNDDPMEITYNNTDKLMLIVQC